MDDIKKKVDRYLLENAEKWINLGYKLLDIPEGGFREYKTGGLAREWFEGLGQGDVINEAATGQRIRLKGGARRAHIAFMGEMDAIYCPSHPRANKETGLAHACGHNIQMTALLAVAEALSATGAMKDLAGDVSFIAAPAEEPLPAEIISSLIQEGKTASDSGKKELLRLGALDDIDIALGTHAYVNDEAHTESVLVNTSCNGLISMSFIFRGKSAHSSVCPEKGVNALNAAILTVNNIQSLRETFDPAEYIRVS